MNATDAARPIAVIGGGLAGLSAALELADAGKRVTLLERRPFVGGKAFSFTDPEHDVTLDNGQHITMRCCTEFQRFLERIGASSIVRYQDHLEVAVVDPDSRGRRVSVLSGGLPSPLSRFGLNLPAPLHLMPAMTTYEHLTTSEKSRLGLALLPLQTMRKSQRAKLDRQSFADWLAEHGQTTRVIERFWDVIILPTCNDRSRDVSAAQAIQVFQDGFTSNARAADIGLFTRGLGEVAEAARRTLETAGGQTLLDAPVQQIVAEHNGVCELRYGQANTLEVDAVVLALPPQQALRLIPNGWRAREPFWRLGQHEVSPIVNLHMQWDRPVMTRDFVAVLDPDAQFIFNRTKIHGWSAPPHWISVSLSGAHELNALPKAELLERVERAVRHALPRTAAAALLATRIVREAEATFRPKPGIAAHRVGPRTPLRNLVLAGAWTATGWPATMESAVRSGRAAAHALLESQSHNQ